MYQVRIIYKDDHNLNVELSQEEAEEFFACLNDHKIFWNKEKLQGFWTNINEIRYMQVIVNEPQEKKCEPCEVVAECAPGEPE